MVFIDEDKTAAIGEKACSPMNDKYKKSNEIPCERGYPDGRSLGDQSQHVGRLSKHNVGEDWTGRDRRIPDPRGSGWIGEQE